MTVPHGLIAPTRLFDGAVHARVLTNTRSYAIANVGVAGMPPAELARALFDRFRIWTVAIDGAGVRGVRVTPQLFTTTAELDALVRALRTLAA